MASVLLRSLLAICLVLNGIGNAVAGVAVHQTMQADTQSAAMQHDPGMAMQMQMQMAGDADACGNMAMHAVDAAPQAPDGHDPDCCKHGVCKCACMQHAPVLPLALIALPRVSERLPPVALPVARRAAPPMPEQLRPPIG